MKNNRMRSLVSAFILTVMIWAVLGMLTPSNATASYTYTPEWGWVSDKDPVFATAEEQFEYAWSMQKKGMFKEAAKSYDMILRYHATSDLSGMAAYRSSICLMELGYFYRAYRRLERVMSDLQSSVTLDKSLANRKRELAEAQKNKENAGIIEDLKIQVEVLEKLVTDQPEEETKRDIIRLVIAKEYEIASLFLAGTRKEFLYLRIFSAYKEAQEIFEKVRSYDRFGEYGDKSLFGAAQALVKQKLFDRAVEYFETLIREYPATPLRSLSYFEIAEALYLKNHYPYYDIETLERAKKYYKEYLRLDSNGIRAVEAEKRLSTIHNSIAEWHYRTIDYYERNNQYAAAVSSCEWVMQKYIDTNWALEAAKRIDDLKAKAKKHVGKHTLADKSAEHSLTRKQRREMKQRAKFQEAERMRVIYYEAEKARRLGLYYKNQLKAEKTRNKFNEKQVKDGLEDSDNKDTDNQPDEKDGE